ncbi:MAG: hypothetical protein EXS00_08800 [Phycisphaerales bacterium]|nr:hypothetical protein [Phycisphaerales bacterium]
MTEESSDPSTPWVIAGNSCKGRLLLGGCAALSLVAFLVGWLVVADVRERARNMDGALRYSAWVLLCFADAHDGGFPSSAEMLADWGIEHGACDSLNTQVEGVPARRIQALAGASTAPDLRAMLAIEITYPEDDTQAPHIASKGEPSGLGTLEAVNGWLRAAHAARHHQESAATPSH